MGLFAKTPKPIPKITVEGIQIEFHQEFAGWEFRYRGTKFLSFEAVLTLPATAQLDSILEAVQSLKLEMRTRLQKGLSEWADSKLDDGESDFVNVQDYATQGVFTVS